MALRWVCKCRVVYLFFPVLTLFRSCPFPTHRLIVDCMVLAVTMLVVGAGQRSLCRSLLLSSSSPALSLLPLSLFVVVVIVGLIVVVVLFFLTACHCFVLFLVCGHDRPHMLIIVLFFLLAATQAAARHPVHRPPLFCLLVLFVPQRLIVFYFLPMNRLHRLIVCFPSLRRHVDSFLSACGCKHR